MFTDLQDEAGRLAVEILREQHEKCQPGTLVSYHIAAEVLAIELRERLQAPPESADELLSKSNNAALLPIDNKPQACEHKMMWRSSGGTYCTFCKSWLNAPNSPQEPTVIPPLKCPKCGGTSVHVDRKKRIHCYECKAVSES